jgi:hypothetical protein
LAGDPYVGIDNINARFRRLVTPSAADVEILSEQIAFVMVEDNRAGVLSGMDRNGNPAPGLKYRGGSGRRTFYRARSSPAFGIPAREIRRGGKATAGMLRFKGLDPRQSRPDRQGRVRVLANNNLSTWAYQQLDGPRLAPRRDASRVIANYEPANPPGVRSAGAIVVTCVYRDILSPKGTPLLRAHLRGENGLPRYDIAGVRPAGKRRATTIANAWLRNLAGL